MATVLSATGTEAATSEGLSKNLHAENRCRHHVRCRLNLILHKKKYNHASILKTLTKFTLPPCPT
eukprot:754385-Hanusia_phi.AAC.3